MKAGKHAPRRRQLLLFATTLLVASKRTRALDHPDAPDRIAAFQTRAKPFEDRLGAESGGSSVGPAAAAYARFLDTELNQAYDALLARLEEPARRALILSQRQWLRWREAEWRFVQENWTMAQFGTSSSLSRAYYRSDVTKDRILMLLGYMANYP